MCDGTQIVRVARQIVRITQFSLPLIPFAANDLDASTSLLGSVVVRCRDLFLGYCAGYDTGTSKITKNDIGLAYYCPDVDFHFRCTNIPSEYGLSVLYKGRVRHHDLSRK